MSRLRLRTAVSTHSCSVRKDTFSKGVLILNEVISTESIIVRKALRRLLIKRIYHVLNLGLFSLCQLATQARSSDFVPFGTLGLPLYRQLDTLTLLFTLTLVIHLNQILSVEVHVLQLRLDLLLQVRDLV